MDKKDIIEKAPERRDIGFPNRIKEEAPLRAIGSLPKHLIGKTAYNTHTEEPHTIKGWDAEHNVVILDKGDKDSRWHINEFWKHFDIVGRESGGEAES